MSLYTIAPEILSHIFSFLPLLEVYRLRSVCRHLQQQGEQHIFTFLTSRHVPITISTLSTNAPFAIELYARTYESNHRVIEFYPTTSDGALLSLANNASAVMSTSHTGLRIQLKMWTDASKTDVQSVLEAKTVPVEQQAIILFHARFNPVVEQILLIPAAPESQAESTQRNENDQRYIGDKGMIMSFSYINRDGTVVKESSGSTESQASFIRINWIRANLAWLLSGFVPDITTPQIYDQRYKSLSGTLSLHDIHSYNTTTESILQYISQHEQLDGQVPSSLLQSILADVKKDETRLVSLQRKLTEVDVDPRVIWKYTFAKNRVLGSQDFDVDETVRRIQSSEQSWKNIKRGYAEYFRCGGSEII